MKTENTAASKWQAGHIGHILRAPAMRHSAQTGWRIPHWQNSNPKRISRPNCISIFGAWLST
jgi:hypothetical protein